MRGLFFLFVFAIWGFHHGHAQSPTGYLNENGIVKCPPPTIVGDIFFVPALNKNFTKVNQTMLLSYRDSNNFKNFTTSCTTGVEDMSRMFEYKTDFNHSISTWDTSSVEDMSYMFNLAVSFNQDISNWTTSSVLHMTGMFVGAEKFNSDISNWNTRNVTNMGGMFSFARKFNSDISNWTTSSVEDMSYMFQYAEKFNSDISNWTTSSVRNMNYMFYDAKHFNQDISNWDISSVKYMNGMFQNASSFNQSLTNWCVNISVPTDFSLHSPIDSNLAFQPLWNGTGCTNKCYNGIRNTSDYSCICVDEFIGIYCDKGTTTTLTSTITSTLTSISNKPPNETTSSKLSASMIVVIVLSVCFAIFSIVIIIWFMKRNKSTGKFIPILKTDKSKPPVYLFKETFSLIPKNNSYDLKKAAQIHNIPFNIGQKNAKEFFNQKETKNTPHERNFNLITNKKSREIK
jgi:surface protein